MKLYSIPFSQWIRMTVARMLEDARDDSASWTRFWSESYTNLGGTSSSGFKDCPRLAAYGLWWLGRIAEGGRPTKDWSLHQVKEVLGKNATYAVLTLELLEMGWDANDKSGLWNEVQNHYRLRLDDIPAKSEQGAAKVATN